MTDNDDFGSGEITIGRQDASKTAFFLERLTSFAPENEGDEVIDEMTRALACAIVEVREARYSIGYADLFAEPAWDILLKLYCDSSNDFALTNEELAAAAHVDGSAVERWLRILVDRGLALRTSDDHLAATLSAAGTYKIKSYLQSLIKRSFKPKG